MNIAFFDLETKWLFDDIAKKRGASRYDVNPSELGLAVAGIAINQEEVKFFTENEIEEMIEMLLNADMIVGHNLLEFDWYVLTPYISSDKIKKLMTKTFDTLQEISKITGSKTGLGLDSLAKATIGLGKTHDTLQIPKIWREGKHEEVKGYLKNDIEMTRKLFHHGCKMGYIKTMDGETIKVSWKM